MGQVTGGRVVFSRTVKVTEYEPKKAEAELTFSLDEGEDYKELFDHASAAAAHKVYEMLGLKVPMPSAPQPHDPLTGDDAKAAYAAKAAQDKLKQTEIPASTKRGPGRPPKAKTEPAVEPDFDPADPTKLPENLRRAQNTVASSANGNGAAVPDPAAVEEPEEWAAEASEVTDVDLTKAVGAVNAKIKNAPAIKQLIGKYVKPPGQLREVPQAKRQAFLVELNALAG